MPAATFYLARSPQASIIHANSPSPARDPDNPHTLSLCPSIMCLLDFLGVAAWFVVLASPLASTETAALVLPLPGTTAAGVSLRPFALAAVLFLLSCGSCSGQTDL